MTVRLTVIECSGGDWNGLDYQSPPRATEYHTLINEIVEDIKYIDIFNRYCGRTSITFVWNHEDSDSVKDSGFYDIVVNALKSRIDLKSYKITQIDACNVLNYDWHVRVFLEVHIPDC